MTPNEQSNMFEENAYRHSVEDNYCTKMWLWRIGIGEKPSVPKLGFRLVEEKEPTDKATDR